MSEILYIIYIALLSLSGLAILGIKLVEDSERLYKFKNVFFGLYCFYVLSIVVVYYGGILNV